MRQPKWKEERVSDRAQHDEFRRDNSRAFAKVKGVRKKVDRTIHPHGKPLRLITRLIGAVTNLGDLVVNPAAGSFVVMRAAKQLGREFVGCKPAVASPRGARTTSPAAPAGKSAKLASGLR
jgi:DNA modification methylase